MTRNTPAKNSRSRANSSQVARMVTLLNRLDLLGESMMSESEFPF
jgi:hypothetical protein